MRIWLEGTWIGRAGFDVVRSVSTRRPQPKGPHNVIPGNLGERAWSWGSSGFWEEMLPG